MAEKNYNMIAVVPEMPRTIDEQQLHVYVPVGSTGNYGVFKPDGQQFYVGSDGVLVADVTKLIKLAEPPAKVVEDGGAIGASVEFTEPDNTLNRKFKFTFKNIKGDKGDTGAQGPKGDTGEQGPKGDTGEQGPKGDNGLIALEYNYAYEDVATLPDPGTQLTIYNTHFNRKPVVNDGVWVPLRLPSEALATYITLCQVTKVESATSTVFTSKPVKIKGDDGVSITSVTQTGVDGGTLVTITLSNGQSTQFVVKNGINTQFTVVQELPTTNISTSTIYLVPSAHSVAENIYDEYIYVNNDWEHIGSTSIDLTDYVTKTFFNQNVGDATKNYVVAQLANVHNFYKQIYTEGSVPEVGQGLSLSVANFERAPAVDQYFSLLEVVNTKYKYYTICKITELAGEFCNAIVVAVTELDSSADLDAIRESIATLSSSVTGLTTTVNGKLDKVTGTTDTKQVYAKNADGQQTMLNVGGTASENIATVGQTEPYHITLTSTSGNVTQDQYNGLKADDRSYIWWQTKKLAKVYKDDNRIAFSSTSGGWDNTIYISKDLSYYMTASEMQTVSNKATEITGTGDDYKYPTTKAVVDYVAAHASSAYHIRLNGNSGTLTPEQLAGLTNDTDSYILFTSGDLVFKLCKNVSSTTQLIYSSVVGTVERKILITPSTKQWRSGETYLEETANKATTIDESSTDLKYPSAKATYTYGQNVLTAAKTYADSILGAEQTWLTKIDSGEGV